MKHRITAALAAFFIAVAALVTAPQAKAQDFEANLCGMSAGTASCIRDTYFAESIIWFYLSDIRNPASDWAPAMWTGTITGWRVALSEAITDSLIFALNINGTTVSTLAVSSSGSTRGSIFTATGLSSAVTAGNYIEVGSSGKRDAAGGTVSARIGVIIYQ